MYKSQRVAISTRSLTNSIIPSKFWSSNQAPKQDLEKPNKPLQILTPQNSTTRNMETTIVNWTIHIKFNPTTVRVAIFNRK